MPALHLKQRVILGLVALVTLNGFFILFINLQAHWPSDQTIPKSPLSFDLEGSFATIQPHFFVGSAEEMRKHYHKNKRQYFHDRGIVYRFLEQSATHHVCQNAWFDRIRNLKCNSIGQYPPAFWLRVLIGLFAVAVTFLIWANRPNSLAASYLLATSVMLMLVQWSSALDVISNVVFLHPIMAWLISFGNGLGTVGFACFGTISVMMFPRPLAHHKLMSLVIIAIFSMALLVILFSGFEFGIPLLSQQLYLDNHYLYLCALASYPFVVVFCILQWRNSKRDAALRAMTLWVIMSWTIGPGLFLLLHVIPLVMNLNPWIPRSMASGVLFSSFALMLIAIARFPMLQIEKHVGYLMRWLTVVIILLVLDIILIATLDIDFNQYGIWMILLSVLLYAPLRDALTRRLTQHQRQAITARISEVTDSLTKASMETNTDQQATWLAALNRLFDPISITVIDTEMNIATYISQSQTRLSVRSCPFSAAIQLEHADKGRRLFRQEDIELADSMLSLFERLQFLRASYTQGQREERRRIRKDLHDQIGHNLINIIYSTKDEKSKDLARETLDELRALIAALNTQGMTISALTDEFSAIAEKALTPANISLDIHVEYAVDAQLSPSISLNLLNILRELLTNTIKHAKASAVSIHACVDDHADLSIQYTDNGQGLQQKCCRGHGISNIKSRLAEMNGHFELRSENGINASIRLSLR